MLKCNLSILLAERNLKIAQVAKETGISRTTLTSLALNHAKGIQLDTLNSLCTYLNVTPSQLILHIPLEINIESINKDNILSEDTPRISDAIIKLRIITRYDNRICKISVGLHDDYFPEETNILTALLHPLYNRGEIERKKSESDIRYLYNTINILPYQIQQDILGTISNKISKGLNLIDGSPIIRISWDLGGGPVSESNPPELYIKA